MPFRPRFAIQATFAIFCKECRFLPELSSQVEISFPEGISDPISRAVLGKTGGRALLTGWVGGALNAAILLVEASVRDLWNNYLRRPSGVKTMG